MQIFHLFQRFLVPSLGTLLHLMPWMKHSGLSHARWGALANNHTCFTMTGSSLRALQGQADCLWSLELGKAMCCAPKPSTVTGAFVSCGAMTLRMDLHSHGPSLPSIHESTKRRIFNEAQAGLRPRWTTYYMVAHRDVELQFQGIWAFLASVVHEHTCRQHAYTEK